jgi:cytochrome c2
MKVFASAMVVAILFIAAQDVQAFDKDGGNALWGKYAIQTCRSCHKDKGLTALDPGERSSKEWEAFFVNDYKKLQDLDHDFSAVGINDRQLENIHRYLVETSAKKHGGAVVAKTAKKPSATTTTASKRKTAQKPKKGSDKKFDMAAGSAGKGRYIFRKCRACHKRNKGPAVSPGDRTKKAWDRFFSGDFRKFKKAMPDFDTYHYSVSQMEHLHQFFRKYALDAEKPKTCE